MSIHPSKDRERIEIEMAEMTELVRGQEEALLERLKPLVRSRSLTLELSGVERIDAAGIAALITLYRLAAEAGHSFAVSHAKAHVEEILQLVGLERILAPRGEQDSPCPSLRMEMSAA
ncbi:MAG TPA: STAS domain-containing protein [Terracidiphilus sp.]|nr:STAS domain-containing protein [Terracidiphilus sp.]